MRNNNDVMLLDLGDPQYQLDLKSIKY